MLYRNHFTDEETKAYIGLWSEVQKLVRCEDRISVHLSDYRFHVLKDLRERNVLYMFPI